MDHITEETIVDLIGGGEIAGARAHLVACARCRKLHRRWIERMESLRALYRESLDDAALHRLRVMYRQLGPQPVEAVWIVRN